MFLFFTMLKAIKVLISSLEKYDSNCWREKLALALLTLFGIDL